MIATNPGVRDDVAPVDGGRRSARRTVPRLGGAAGVVLVLALALGCGGGSPSDVVPPDEVDVSISPVQQPAARSLRLELAAASGPDLGIQLVGQDLEGATGVAFELRYDDAFLEFTGAGPGTFFGSNAVLGANVVETAPGVLVGVAATPDQANGVNGSGTLLTLQFQLRQLRDNETLLSFGVPQSLVYGPGGVAGNHSFTDARLVTRIRVAR